MRVLRRFAVPCASLLLLLPVIAPARPFRPGMIPNGTALDGVGCVNCHVSPLGGGTRNAFGLAVEALVSPGGTEVFWSPALAALNSDGDAASNGAELQDPLGEWTSGSPNPGEASLVTNPGVPDPTPSPTPSPPPTPTVTPSPSPTPPCGPSYTPGPTPYPDRTPPPSTETTIELPYFGGAVRFVGSGQSIQDAVDASSPGDRIVLGASNYNETVTISVDGLLVESAPGVRARWSGEFVSYWAGTPQAGMPAIRIASGRIVLRGIDLSGSAGWGSTVPLLGRNGMQGGPAIHHLSPNEGIVDLLDCLVAGGNGGHGEPYDTCSGTCGRGGGGMTPVLGGAGVRADLRTSFRGGAGGGSQRTPTQLGPGCCIYAAPPGSPALPSAGEEWVNYMETPAPFDLVRILLGRAPAESNSDANGDGVADVADLVLRAGRGAPPADRGAGVRRPVVR